MAENQKQNSSQVGEQIRAAVQEGLATGDFKQFNAVVADTVSHALKEGLGGKSDTDGTFYTHPAYARAAQKKQEREQQEKSRQERQQMEAAIRNGQQTDVTQIRMNKVGNVAGILYMTFGGIGVGVNAILLAVFLPLMLITGSTVPVAITGGLLTGFAAMLKVGCDKHQLLKRAWRYIEFCGVRGYINIDDLAAQTGMNKRRLLKDIKKMIRLNIYPEGHLDGSEKCLMLNDRTYQEYLRLQKERKYLEEQQVEYLTEKKPAKQAKSKIDPELAALTEEGKGYLDKIRTINDRLPGEVISGKLFRLEQLLKEIFERTAEHPEQLPQLQKLMSYYLPTTLKLVEAYEEFDRVSVQGAEILEARNEIEKTLDTINQAFAELLNQLFTATVYDVTTDAQVLQTMLSKDGLTKDSAFTKK